ncbi:MFS transporter [Nitrincola iocasae]|uniref:MFS transporter n=1 Tax=Nitrincola iocasae TaxID=2614693 RepID=A0A5J6LCR2_9GAMM|nr:MFS transporter [Nitrincola iocasae]QEW06011.1 MFS transporter [Nitrincola iocasae]
MFTVLANHSYRQLFLAQIVALLGTGLATVALSLLAYDLADSHAGMVIGTALTIKMLAYVFIAPLASALFRALSRKKLLVTLDLIRASVAVFLPFVSEAWHVYVLIFILQSASACFTPMFQATIPDILKNEEQYTQALSLSRLAYDLENLISPALAALMLTLMAWQGLFTGTVIGFFASALLILSVTFPTMKAANKNRSGIYQKTTRGIRFYLATPRLRGLLAMNVAVTCAGAMVIVNSVVIVQSTFGLSAQDTALAFTFFGGGSMCAALTMPRLLKRMQDRTLMLGATLLLILCLFSASRISHIIELWTIWFLLGAGYAWIQTPSGRLLTRSSHEEDRPDLFAAQFSLSHACWLFAYPLAGWLGVKLGISLTFIVFGMVALLAYLLALKLWPAEDPEVVEHYHANLPEHHPHIAHSKRLHSHPFVIDDLHEKWPR